MQKVCASPECVSTLRDLAEDHVKVLSRFQIIPQSHPAVLALKIISGIAAGVLSVMIYKSHKQGAVILGSTAFILICHTAIGYYSTSKAIANQKKEIDDLFDPCIKGLEIEQCNKAHYIVDKIEGQPKESIQILKESIDREAANYDADESLKTLDQVSYKSLQESGSKVMKMSSLNLPDTLHTEPLVKEKFDSIIARSYRFIKGSYICDWLGQNAYVRYMLRNGVADVSHFRRGYWT
ncbi:MAG: hypothetical protein ABSA17_06865 [Rhabdochlamydiaceae bacterium]|jgi:hypothetical protein